MRVIGRILLEITSVRSFCSRYPAEYANLVRDITCDTIDYRTRFTAKSKGPEAKCVFKEANVMNLIFLT